MGSKHLLKRCAVTISCSSTFFYHHLLRTHHRPFFSPLLSSSSSKPISNKILPTFASTSSRWLCSTPLSRGPPTTTVQVEEDDRLLAALKQKLEELGIRCDTARPAQNNPLMCPKCEGGSTMVRSLTLLISEDCKTALWNCHRGKCGWKSKQTVNGRT